MKTLTKQRANMVIFLILAVQFIFIFLYSRFSIWAADDYANYNVYWLDGHTFSWGRLFQAWYLNFYLFTGRHFSTIVNAALLNGNKAIFDFLNACFFTVCLVCIYTISKPKKDRSPVLRLLVVISLVWLLLPAFGQVVAWQIGSVIYLWTITLVLLAILPFVLLMKGTIKKKPVWFAVLLFLLGLPAGNGLETNSGMMMLFMGTILVYRLVKKLGIPAWAWAGFAGALLGTLSNVLSPGAFTRSANMAVSGAGWQRLALMVGRIFDFGFVASEMYILIFLTVICFIIFYLYRARQSGTPVSIEQKIFIAATFFIAGTIFILGLVLTAGNLSLFTFFQSVPQNLLPMIAVPSAMLVLAYGVFCLILAKVLFGMLSTVNRLFIFSFFLIAWCGIGSYVMAPVSRARSYMGMAIFLMIVCVYTFFSTNFKKIPVQLMATVAGGIFATVVAVTAMVDTLDAYRWWQRTDSEIRQQIDAGEERITAETYLATNPYVAASAEKWVIPAIIEDGELKAESGVHRHYEWINIEITKYYFNDGLAWYNGKRIIGTEPA